MTIDRTIGRPRAYSVAQFEAAFTEWARRTAADPDNFLPMFDDTPEAFGPGATKYFLKLLDEQRRKPTPPQKGEAGWIPPRNAA